MAHCTLLLGSQHALATAHCPNNDRALVVPSSVHTEAPSAAAWGTSIECRFEVTSSANSQWSTRRQNAVCFWLDSFSLITTATTTTELFVSFDDILNYSERHILERERERESKVKGAHFPWQSLVRPFSVARRGVPERQQCDTMRIAAEAYHSAHSKRSTHCLSEESTERAGEDNHALIDHFIYIGWRARQSNLSSHSRQLSPWNAVTALKNDFLSFSPLLHSTCPAHYHCFLCRCSLTASHFICLHWIFTSGVTVILLFW